MPYPVHFSVLIIVKGRTDHLHNVLVGITKSSCLPDEIIIVHMNEAISDLPDHGLTIRQISLDDEHPLPLAKARNRAAAEAKYDNLIFLDVDCIPNPTCFETLLAETEEKTLCMADPRYLVRPATEINFAGFEAEATLNSVRSGLEYGLSTRYELFWSLGFAISRGAFKAIGGFDENFTGYGGEDTDFGFSARQAGIQIFFSEARVYHQPHPSYDPPLNWLADIVTNAEVFKHKWQVWPMQGWLQAFAEAGYINWRNDGDSIRINHLPTTEQIADSLK